MCLSICLAFVCCSWQYLFLIIASSVKVGKGNSCRLNKRTNKNISALYLASPEQPTYNISPKYWLLCYETSDLSLLFVFSFDVVFFSSPSLVSCLLSCATPGEQKYAVNMRTATQQTTFWTVRCAMCAHSLCRAHCSLNRHSLLMAFLAIYGVLSHLFIRRHTDAPWLARSRLFSFLFSSWLLQFFFALLLFLLSANARTTHFLPGCHCPVTQCQCQPVPVAKSTY